MEKISHHYVPQFYLKNFSTNHKSIGMYIDKHSNYIRQASIKKQACKDYLYGRDQIIEDTLMGLESKVFNIIKHIIDTYKIPSNQSKAYHLLILFILILEVRVQRQADSMNNLINEQVKAMAKMSKEHGKLDVTEKTIDEMRVSLDIPNLPLMQAAAQIYPIILDLKATLILIENDRMFITSDNPVVRYNYMYVIRKYTQRGYGLGNMGIQIFLPISPKCCLYIYDNVMYNTSLSKQDNIILTKGKHVDELNKLFYMNSYDFLFFNEKVKESYIRRIVSKNKHENDVKREVNILGSASNKLIAYQKKCVKDRINMPFLRIDPQFKNMPLPTHMAGPMRPYAERFRQDKD